MPDVAVVNAHHWGERLLGARAATLTRAAIDEALAERKHTFADVRLSETEEMRLYAVSGSAPDERLEGHSGLGVRVIVDGAWGFASQPLTDVNDAPRRGTH